MSELTLDDLVDLEAYEALRPGYRERVIAHKAVRRISIGDRVSLLFEDLETVRYQILEMARIERIRDPGKLAHEIEVYGELIPQPSELSATLFIEIPEPALVRAELDRLLGIDEHVELVIGEGSAERAIAARFDTRQLEEERISAVHYLRFALAPADTARFASERLRLRITHPAYLHEAELPESTRASLLADLHGRMPRLLDRASAPPPARDQLIEARAGVRVVRPARSASRDHLVIEADIAGRAALDAPPNELAVFFEVLRARAREICERTGGVRMTADLERGAPATLKIHLIGKS